MNLKAIPVNQGDFRTGANQATSFCYAHGELESVLGYDLLNVPTGMPEEGIHPIEIEGYDGGCWAWVWTPNFWGTKVMIVVDIAYVEDLEFAREKFTTKGDV